MSQSAFESLADSLLAALEEGIGAHADAELQGGILTVDGDDGTWVVNKHAPTRQIWLSSPQSGARHYAFDAASGQWKDTRGGPDLLAHSVGRAGRVAGLAAAMNRFAGLRLLGPYLRPYRGRTVLAALLAPDRGRHRAGLRRLPARPDRPRLRPGPAGHPELCPGLADRRRRGAGDRLGRALLPGVVAGRARGGRPAPRPVRPCRAAGTGLVRDQALGRRHEPHLGRRPAHRAGDRLVGLGGAAQFADVRRRRRHAGGHQSQARPAGAGRGAAGGGAHHPVRPQGPPRCRARRRRAWPTWCRKAARRSTRCAPCRPSPRRSAPPSASARPPSAPSTRPAAASPSAPS